MRNHALLYLLRPNAEPGEYDWVGESNSTLPVLWRILFAVPAIVQRSDVERIFEGAVQHHLATNAADALERYERVASWLLRQPLITALAEVARYLDAVGHHLRHLVSSCRYDDEPPPFFVMSLDEFIPPDAVAAQVLAAQWWRAFEQNERVLDCDLEALCGIRGTKWQLADWRAWAELFGFALFVEPYFAESFRAPQKSLYLPRTGVDAADDTCSYQHGLAVGLRDDRYGYRDVHGAWIIEPQFDEADDFTAAGVARIGKQRRYGLLRIDGTWAVPLELEALDWRADLRGWLGRRGKRQSLFHADGAPWLLDWDGIDALVSGELFRVRRDGAIGALHWSGEEAVPLQFSNIEMLEPHSELCASANPPHLLRVYSIPQRSRPRAGVWNVRTREPVLPCGYDHVWPLLCDDEGRYGFLVARKDDAWRLGVCDSDGRLVIACEYEWLAERVVLNRPRAFERIREALFAAWSRGRPALAGRPDGTMAWLAPPYAAPNEVVTLRSHSILPTPMSDSIAVAFYKFVELPDYAELRDPLLAHCEARSVKGTILLAAEGINGTIAGRNEDVRAVLAYLRADARLADLEHKESPAPATPFYRMKVRLKREIVTMGVPAVHPARMAGTYVKPEDWNALIDDPNVVVIDARNDYEVQLGTFKGAINPHTRSFRELPQWLREQPLLKDKPKVAMFCTGGIRCEKSTAFLRSEGFEHVYHLQGGILKYLETIPEDQSRWQGECFVFDERVALGHGLKLGEHELCRSCREPLSPHDKASEHYVPGVSCPKCYHRLSETKKRGLMERQRQVELARQRNDQHIGIRQELRRKLKR